ncbi:MAG: Gldg family protein [Clostridia bacterium]|nr:Gldg family protein [Clostridia bacterium]
MKLFEKIMRNKIAGAIISLSLILILLILNFGLDALVIEKNGFFDATDEHLYTLSSDFKEEIKDIDKEIKITFCTDKDYLLANYQTRYVYIMAKEIEMYKDNIKVETVNISKNPTAIQKYKTTSATKINEGDVIISCGERFRILSSQTFWSYDSSGDYWAFNGEYKIANAFLSLSAYETPTAYFTVGHGESVYDESNPDTEESQRAYEFYRLLIDNGLTVKTVNLDEEDIPEDCALLIINAPKSDYNFKKELDREGYYYVNETSPIEKIDRYLDDVGSLMVFKDPFTVLPTLEEYLSEWGMKAEPLQVKDRAGESEDRSLVSAMYPNAEKNPLGASLYSDIINLASPPKTFVKDAGYITETWEDNQNFYTPGVTAMYSPVLLSSDTARAYDEDGLLFDYSGSYHLAGITARVKSVEVSRYYSYVFYGASSSFTSSEQLRNDAYANYDILFSAVRTLSRTDVYASDSLGALSMNTANYGGKILNSDEMSTEIRQIYENKQVVKTYRAMSTKKATLYTVLCLILPLLIIPAVCIYVTGKRRYM